MGRHPDSGRLQQISDQIEQHPGIHPAEIAKHLELARSNVTRALPALEDAGYLLSEDRRGGLWRYGRGRSGKQDE